MIEQIERLPDVNFIDDITLTDIQTQLAEDYETKFQELTGETVSLKEGEPIKLILNACAVQLLQMYQNVDKAGKMNLLKYAYGDYLDNLCAFKGVERKGATGAVCTVRFTVSDVRPHVISIPQGTRVTTISAIIYFATTEYAEIPAGAEYVDVVCQALTLGTEGNGIETNQICVMVDPVAYIGRCRNITVTNGAIDKESDENLKDRYYLAPGNFSVAGPEEAYVYFTKLAYPDLADVHVSSPSATEIDIRVIGQDGEMLSQEVLTEISDYLEHANIRPLTDNVTVANPTAATYSISMTYYINRSDAQTVATIQKNIEKAVNEYVAWQSAKIGRDIEPGKLIELCMAAGAKRVEITTPVRTVVSNTAIPVLGSEAEITYGGLEND